MFPIKKAALGYLLRGFSVIPTEGKVPLIKWQKYTRERPTEKDIEEWWNLYPEANVGIVTGEISGIIVLDVDSIDGERFLKDKHIPETLKASTGKGFHLYFKHPGFQVQNMVRKVPGVDIRGDGGFVVAPPSKHESGATYKWLVETDKIAEAPEWLIGLIERKPTVLPARPNKLSSVLDGVPEGQRDNALFRYACRLRAKNLDYEEAKRLVLEAAENCDPPFPQKDALLKLEQAWKYSPGMASSIVGQQGNKVSVQGSERTLHLTWPELGLHADVSGIKQHTDGTITGVLQIKSTAPGVPVVIHSKSLFNFSKARTRSELIRNLSERVHGFEWGAIVDELCSAVTEWVSEGEGVIDLSEIEAEEPQYLLHPILLKEEPVVIFGERGSTKSYLALWIATMVATGSNFGDSRLYAREKTNVLYLDYEQSENNMAWRLECIARGLGIPKPTIYYRRCSRPLNTDVDRIKKLMLENDVGLLVIDSLGPACGGDLNSAQVALEFHNALRTLRTSPLIVAHTAKNQEGRKSIFGSVYFENLSRSIFEIRSEVLPGESEVSTGLIHRKCNFGQLVSPLGFKLRFDKDKTTITPEDARSLDILSSEMPISERILDFIGAQGPATPRKIANALKVDIGYIRAKLSKLVKEGLVEVGEDGTYALSIETVPF